MVKVWAGYGPMQGLVWVKIANCTGCTVEKPTLLQRIQGIWNVQA